MNSSYAKLWEERALSKLEIQTITVFSKKKKNTNYNWMSIYGATRW